MGFLARLPTIVTPMRAQTSSQDAGGWDPFDDRWYMPESWAHTLTLAGIQVTPELALTLSAYYAGVSIISYDLATLPCQVFKLRDDGGKDRVRGGSFMATGGIGNLVYMLRWQPNNWQSFTEWMLSMIAQYLLRGRAFSEIVHGRTGAIDQLLPRHPDRVTTQRLSTGNVRYKVTEANGEIRYITQEEMFAFRDLSIDGLNGSSRIQYGAGAIGTALAAEAAAARFFKSGMTAATVATYKGGLMGEEEEKQLHGAITRYATGQENNFGLMLIPDDVSITNLGVEPEKAQMMLAREWGVKEVARQLRLPGYKLGIPNATSYASQVQAAIDYIVSTLRPIAVTFEQAAQRDLILAKDTYFVEILLDALMRGDPDSRAAYYEKAIRNRWMRPSEVRLRENMNPDPVLDKLSESDFRPGKSGGDPSAPEQPGTQPPPPGSTGSRATYRAMMHVHDLAQRCVRRERAAVEKLARKHANDPDAWATSLREYFADHATFIAEILHLHPAVAAAYSAQHGSEYEVNGAATILGDDASVWERWETDELAALALAEGNTISAWFDRRLTDIRAPQPVHVTTPVTVASGAVQVTMPPVQVPPSVVNITERTVHVDVAPAAVTVQPPNVTVESGDTHVHVPPPVAVERVTTVERNQDNLITSTRTRDVPVE